MTNDQTHDHGNTPAARPATSDDGRSERTEHHDADPETITEDAIEFFGDDGETGSPTSDADAPPPG